MRIILVDDEKLSLEQMEHILGSYEDVDILGLYTDPIASLERIKSTKPDVVMLDISMPVMNGFQVAQEIVHISPDTLIIFITAYDQYALKAFESEAVDYILKPFSPKRIDKAIQLVRKRLKENNKKDLRIDSFIHNQTRTMICSRIPVWKNEAVILIDIQQICFCKVIDKKTYIRTLKHEYISSDTLIQLEERLKEQKFFRCHKSFIVNLQEIDIIIPMFNQTFIIKLKDMDVEIPVSRHYAKQLKDIFGF